MTTTEREYNPQEANLNEYRTHSDPVYKLSIDPDLTQKQFELLQQNIEELGIIIGIMGETWDLRLNRPPVNSELYPQLVEKLDIDRTVQVKMATTGLTSSEWIDLFMKIRDNPEQTDFDY